ncbi:glycerol dehydrogenase, partial [Pseudomonas aeruginosa]|nr:glycerol dehydrogenase [Pseudomonas aeruginosa]
MKVFASPSDYIQGKKALFTNVKTLKQRGDGPNLVCEAVVYGIVGERFESYLRDNGMTP